MNASICEIIYFDTSQHRRKIQYIVPTAAFCYIPLLYAIFTHRFHLYMRVHILNDYHFRLSDV